MKFDFETIISNIKRQNYRYIGSGSGRQVFDLGNGYVVKVAKNRKGIAQNKAEYQISLIDNTNLFAKVEQVSQDFILLIMEKAERVKKISDVWRYFHIHSNKQLFQIELLKEISAAHDLLLSDLTRASNWGIIGGDYVVIDYGFTRKVKKRYYSIF